MKLSLAWYHRMNKSQRTVVNHLVGWPAAAVVAGGLVLPPAFNEEARLRDQALNNANVHVTEFLNDQEEALTAKVETANNQIEQLICSTDQIGVIIMKEAAKVKDGESCVPLRGPVI